MIKKSRRKESWVDEELLENKSRTQEESRKLLGDWFDD